MNPQTLGQSTVDVIQTAAVVVSTFGAAPSIMGSRRSLRVSCLEPPIPTDSASLGFATFDRLQVRELLEFLRILLDPTACK